MRDSHVSTHHSPSPQLECEEHPRKGMGVTLLEPASASPLQNYRRYSETTDFRLSPPSGPKAKAPCATLTFPTAGSTNPVSHLDNSINYTIIDFHLTEGLRKTKEDRVEEKKKRIEKERREEETKKEAKQATNLEQTLMQYPLMCLCNYYALCLCDYITYINCNKLSYTAALR